MRAWQPEEPTTIQPEGPGPVPWEAVAAALQGTTFFWIATTDADGRPHGTPVLAVWVDGSLCWCYSPASRKGANLARQADVAVLVEGDELQVVVEGAVEPVVGEDLARVADAYAAKYGWSPEVRDGAFWADGAPSAGPPPYRVVEVRPRLVYAYGDGDHVSATRWSFR